MAFNKITQPAPSGKNITTERKPLGSSPFSEIKPPNQTIKK